jgi:hypothetical protein
MADDCAIYSNHYSKASPDPHAEFRSRMRRTPFHPFDATDDSLHGLSFSSWTLENLSWVNQ